MPNIRTYDPGAIDIRPTEVGVEATAAAARRGGAFFNQAAEDFNKLGSSVASSVRDIGEVAVKYIEQREIAAGAKTFSELQNAALQAWNKKISDKSIDPNDPSVAAKFREEVLEPSLNDFKGKGFLTEGGQKFAEQHVEAFRTKMFHTMSADMSSRAGIALQSNIIKTQNNLAHMVLQDPSFADYAMKSGKDSLMAMIDASGTLTPTQRASFHAELETTTNKMIAESFYAGLAQRNPDAAIKVLDSGKFKEYITPAAAKAIVAEAKRQATAERADVEVRERNAENERKRLSEATRGDYLKRLYSDDPEQIASVSPKLIANDDRLMPATRDHLIALVKRELKPESDARISAQNSRELFRRIHLPDGDPNKITDLAPINQARIDDLITRADHKDLREEVLQARTPEGEKLGKSREDFLKRYAPLIDGLMSQQGTHSLLGTQRLYELTMDTRRVESELRAKGLSPFLAYDPRSEHFMGSPENIAKYRVSSQEAQAYEKTLKAMDAERPKPGELVKPAAAARPPAKELTITTQEQYDKLAPGTEFTSGGKKFRKP